MRLYQNTSIFLSFWGNFFVPKSSTDSVFEFGNWKALDFDTTMAGNDTSGKSWMYIMETFNLTQF